MLILDRRRGQSIIIVRKAGDKIEKIEITVLSDGKQMRLGIDAPPEFKIWRDEIFDRDPSLASVVV